MATITTGVSFFMIFAERRAYAPLPTWAHVDHGIKFLVAESHLNETAVSGCHVAATGAVEKSGKWN